MGILNPLSVGPYSPQQVEKALNLGDVRHVPLRLGGQVVRRSVRVFKGTYDFSLQGGAIGTISLLDAMQTYPLSQPTLLGNSRTFPVLYLPPGFIVLNALIDVITAPTSGGSPTIAISTGVNAGDIKAATAYGSYTGLVAGIPVNTAATAVKVPLTTAQPGSIATIAIATAALTAGKFNVHLEGYLGD
jgi:hypothetical protein